MPGTRPGMTKIDGEVAVIHGHNFPIPPLVSREFCYRVPTLCHQRAQGMPGARRARSLACKK